MAPELVTAIASLREPRTTMGGVNLVAGFRPELWRALAPADSPPALGGFNDDLIGTDDYAMPATQHGAVLWVFGIVLVFVQVPGGALIYAIAGLVIFSGLTRFDFQRLRTIQDIRTAPLLAASTFLDVLNVFVLFLSLLGRAD